MPTELSTNTIPGVTALSLNTTVSTTPASGTVESWSVVIPAGWNITAPGAGVGQYRLLIGSEICLFTSGTTTAGTTQSWSITRGQEGTATATHTAGTPIYLVDTSGSNSNDVQLSPSAAQTGNVAVSGALSGSGKNLSAVPTSTNADVTAGPTYTEREMTMLNDLYLAARAAGLLT